MQYICLGYFDKTQPQGRTDAEQNAMFDKCFEYDDYLRANRHWALAKCCSLPKLH